MSDQNIVYGIHAVEALIAKSPADIVSLVVQHGRQDQRLKTLLAAAKSIPRRELSRHELDELCNTTAHQGIVAKCRSATKSVEYHEADLKGFIATSTKPVLFLILDGVTDPHNLGACLRTADAAGVTAVITPKDRSAGLTPVVRKVACGAAENIPFIQVTNLVRTLKDLQEQGVWIYGTDGEASGSLYTQKFSGHIGLIMGSEGEGMRRLTKEHCDFLLSLPMSGSVSSLNVSVATGICLYEIVRQRIAK